MAKISHSIRPIAVGIKTVAIIPAAAESKPSPGHRAPVLDCMRDCVLSAAEAVEEMELESVDADDEGYWVTIDSVKDVKVVVGCVTVVTGKVVVKTRGPGMVELSDSEELGN